MIIGVVNKFPGFPSCLCCGGEIISGSHNDGQKCKNVTGWQTSRWSGWQVKKISGLTLADGKSLSCCLPAIVSTPFLKPYHYLNSHISCKPPNYYKGLIAIISHINCGLLKNTVHPALESATNQSGAASTLYSLWIMFGQQHNRYWTAPPKRLDSPTIII